MLATRSILGESRRLRTATIGRTRGSVLHSQNGADVGWVRCHVLSRYPELELRFLPVANVSDPFGENPVPWWRGVVRRDRRESAPKGYSLVLGIVGSLAAGLARWHGMDLIESIVLLGPIAVGPAALFEYLWRQRRRRGEEQLLVFPAGQTLQRAPSPGAYLPVQRGR